MFSTETLLFNIHSFLRQRILNKKAMLVHLPPRGRVIDLGCGYGVLAFEAVKSGNYDITGVDADRRRIAIANKIVRARGIKNLHFICADVTRFLKEQHDSYHAVLAVDLFHHIPAEYHVELVQTIYRLLAPGGRFILKDISLYPRYKYLFNYAHDIIINRAKRLYCRDEKEWSRIMEEAGFDIEYFKVPSLFYPHFILKGTKPGNKI